MALESEPRGKLCLDIRVESGAGQESTDGKLMAGMRTNEWTTVYDRLGSSWAPLTTEQA